MRLTPAHDAAFQENISEICTDRLWAKAVECLKIPRLPTFSRWVTGKVWSYEDRRTRWERLMRVPKETSTRLFFAKFWEFSPHGGVGRKERKLVLQLSVKWEVEGDDASRFFWEEKKITLNRYPCFVADVEIFPLTPQQAAFVGAKNVTSKSKGLFWGTAEDVTEIREHFPIAGAF